MSWAASLAATAILAASPAFAATVSGLYEATVPVADRSDAARAEGFTAALGAVAVRVSGSRDASARMAGAGGDARRYVQRFTYNGDGLLQVGFDSGAVNKALADAGLSVWGGERPATLVYLALDNGSATTGADRSAIENAARQRGLPLVWPALSSEDQALLRQPATDAPLGPVIARYGANALLLGRANRSPADGGAVQWTLQFEGNSSTAQGGIDDGIDLAAGTFARTFAARAGSASEVLVDVSGIDTLKSYAETLNYLEGLTLVRAVNVDRVERDTVSFRLGVRGDAQNLSRAIGLGRKLVPAAAEAGTTPPAPDGDKERLRLRYSN